MASSTAAVSGSRWPRLPEVLYAKAADYLGDSRDLESIHLLCTETAKLENLWQAKAPRWRAKAFAYLQSKGIQEVNGVALQRLSAKQICKIGVYAKILEAFPPQFLRGILGSSSLTAYLSLPKLDISRWSIAHLPREIYEQTDEAVKQCNLSEARAAQWVKTRIAHWNTYLLSCRVVDSQNTPHPIMRYETAEGPALVVNTCRVTPHDREFLPYVFLSRNVGRPKDHFHPVHMMDEVICTSAGKEKREPSGRRKFTLMSLRLETSFQGFLNFPYFESSEVSRYQER